MRKLNDISALLIILFLTTSMSYYAKEEPRNDLMVTIIGISTIIFSLSYFTAKLSRKTSKKKIISGQKKGIA